MVAYLRRLIEASGANQATALLVGPVQVSARVAESYPVRMAHSLFSTRMATSMHSVGVAASLVGGSAFAPLCGVPNGAGNGILTVAKGTLPLVRFGSAGYGARQGCLTVPACVARAPATFLLEVVPERLQAGAPWLTAAMGLAARAALLALRANAPRGTPGVRLPRRASR
jgi:hypothetical protein